MGLREEREKIDICIEVGKNESIKLEKRERESEKEKGRDREAPASGRE